MLLYTSLMFGDIEPSHADTDYSKRVGGEERGKKTRESYFTFVLRIVLFNLQYRTKTHSVFITVLSEAVSYSVNPSGVKV